MKEYPVDRWLPIAFLPWCFARERTRSKALKLALIPIGFVWTTALMPVTLLFLVASIAMVFWDDLNAPEPPK